MASAPKPVSPLLAAHINHLACPVCHAPLALAGNAIDCTGCGRRYPVSNGMPVLIEARATLPPHPA